MKNHLLTIALLAFCSCLWGQNWEPFVPGETHHFRSDTADFPDRSVRIDSVRLLAGDSMWYFNRSLERQGWDSADVNVPLFCRRSARVLSGGIFQFIDPDTLTIHTWATTGDSWLIDATHQRIASVAAVYEDSIFGSLDSLKVILIDSLDSLILSKAHGLMAWPAVLGPQHYTKVGIQERQLGETLPSFDEIFAHGVDNIYYWYCYDVDEVGVTMTWQWKMQVDSVHRDSSGLDVHWSGLLMGGTPIGGIWEILDSASYVIHHGHQDAVSNFMSLAPYQLVHIWTNGFFSPGFVNSPWMEDSWTTTLWERAQDSMILRVGFSGLAWDSPVFFANGSPYAVSNGSDMVFSIFRTGLGLTEVNWRIFEGEGYLKMVGYIVGEDTVGTIWPDSVLLNGQTLPHAYTWQAFPNPAQDRISISLQGASEGMLRLFSLSGQEIAAWQVHAGISQCDLGHLPAGMYLLQIAANGQLDHRKLVVRR